MTQEFDLGVILTVTSGISLVDDFSTVSNFFAFAYGVSLDPFSMNEMKGHLTNHILGLYPQLREIDYSKVFFRTTNIDSWLIEQKAKFGEKLNICPVGMSLSDNQGITK